MLMKLNGKAIAQREEARKFRRDIILIVLAGLFFGAACFAAGMAYSARAMIARSGEFDAWVDTAAAQSAAFVRTLSNRELLNF